MNLSEYTPKACKDLILSSLAHDLLEKPKLWDMPVTVSKAGLERIEQFVQLRKSHGDFKYYAYTRHTTEDRAELNCRNGVIGEVVAAKALIQLGLPASYPDLTYKPPAEKSHSPDLVFGNYLNMSVKNWNGDTWNYSATSPVESDSSVSWVFENSDSKHTDPKPNDCCAFTISYRYGSSFIEPIHKLVATAPWSWVKDSLSEMDKEQYRDSKKALYWKTILLTAATES